MYGTLRRALVARKVDLDPNKFKAVVEGRIESVGSTITITEIAVKYEVAVPGGQREAVERALEFHVHGCPAHESVKDAIKVTWSADITEEA